MLTIFSTDRGPTCDGMSRRSFLQVGALGVTGLTLSGLLAARATAASQGVNYLHDKAVVFLFLAGGPSHVETWDPKMTAPVEFRSMTGEVQTKLPGVTFGGTFPKLAALADQLAVVRSFQSGSNSHSTGTTNVLRGNPTTASMGAMYARIRGATNPQTGMVTFAQMCDDARETAYENGRKRVIEGNSPGMLGAACAPFDPSVKGPLQENMTLNVPADRFTDRRSLLQTIDTLRRDLDPKGNIDAIDSYRQQAYDLILGSARDAFDLTKEDPKVVKRYDTNHFKIGHKERHASPLGRHLLLARRLCEAGCGFVTIGSPAWDHHEGGNNPGIVKGLNMVGPPLDHAVSVFLEDLAERGLSDKILLVVTGEMGRTPRINKKGGRDHWGSLCSLLLAGGGLKMGQVIGQSSPKAEVPATSPYKPENLMATIMHTLFDVGQLRVDTSVPRDLAKPIEDGKPIAELF
ncbi:MAG: DUF1501 domain-containing protein [Gemmataceae bacterium]